MENTLPNDLGSHCDGAVVIVRGEGHSEDSLSSSTISQPAPHLSPSRPRGLSKSTSHALVDAAMNIDVDDRISLVIQLLRSMPAAKVQDIVNAMYPILHISFLDRLPPEVCLKILGHLDPRTLINLARTSKLAASLSSDWTLWQSLYYREGFLTNQRELAKFEQELEDSNTRLRNAPPHDHSRPGTSGSPPPKKRSRPTPGDSQNHNPSEDSDVVDVDPAYENPSSMFGALAMASGNTPRLGRDGTSEKAIFSPSPLSPPLFEHQDSSSSGMATESRRPPSSLTTLDRFTNSHRLNWEFLYNQRRRLEDNWVNERYTNYQIPHPDHPEEAHENCIYTLQHDGDRLVSGSRDWTVRIWSLKTCRLIHILKGHKGSVLCVQFDASEEEDIIISGGSDHTVRIWKFSTGLCQQILKNAHTNAVLNLKFNKKILVTCSKDRTLKVFNRQTLYPGDQGYKLPHDFVFKPVPQVVNFPGLVVNPYGDLPIKQPYSLIGTLDGHVAAVNSCQILGNEVVSVSGDRLAKVWDWSSGGCTRTLVGHTKGVACVAYDGRRIVTGSSDCELKVFDRQTGVEVASLKGPGGHTNLIRTVQAGFADIGSEAEVREKDRHKAWAVDKKFFNAYGERPDHDNMRWAMDARSRTNGNAGSEKPEDIICYGATLPPGGGGSQYGRIVSGSYDETIIIWRRDAHNVWKPKTTLRQVEAGRAALLQYELSRPPPPRGTHKLDDIVNSLHSPPESARWHTELMDALIQSGPDALRQGLVDFPNLMNRFPRLMALIRDTGGTAVGPGGVREPIAGGKVLRDRLRAIFHAAVYREIQCVQYRLRSMDQEEAVLVGQIQRSHDGISSAESAQARPVGQEGEGDNFWRQRLFQLLSQQGKMPRNQVAHLACADDPAASLSSRHYVEIENVHLAHLGRTLEELNGHRESARTQHRMLNRMLHDVEAPRGAAAAAAAAGYFGGTGGDGGGGAAAGDGGRGAAAAGGPIGAGDAIVPPNGSNADRGFDGNKVYKLQFDARRIVCASNNPIMLVWDFANGDREIEEASRFFRGVE